MKKKRIQKHGISYCVGSQEKDGTWSPCTYEVETKKEAEDQLRDVTGGTADGELFSVLERFTGIIQIGRIKKI